MIWKLLLIKKNDTLKCVYESHNVFNAIADFPGSAEPGCQKGAFALPPPKKKIRIRTKTY